MKEYEVPAALAAAIRKTCEDRDYRRKLSEGAFRLAQQFDLPLIDAVEVGIYREAMQLAPSFSRRLQLSVFSTRHQVANSPVGHRLKQLLGR